MNPWTKGIPLIGNPKNLVLSFVRGRPMEARSQVLFPTEG